MELAAFVIFAFLAAIFVMIIATPLLIISRIIRMLKNSYAKLFNKPA